MQSFMKKEDKSLIENVETTGERYCQQFIEMKHISPTFMYIIPMYLRLTTFTRTLLKCNFTYLYIFAAGALTGPQLPATASNVCTTDVRLGGVGRVPSPNNNPGYAGAEETGVEILCAASYATRCRDLDTDQTRKEQTCGRTYNKGKEYVQHHIQGQQDKHVSQGEEKSIEPYEKDEMFLGAGHINRIKDDRWTLRVTTWRPYDKKRRQGRPAKR